MRAAIYARVSTFDQHVENQLVELRQRKYLHNLRPQTLEWYGTAWKAFKKSATSCLTDPAALNRAHLEQFVYTLRDRGVRPVTCNTWLRALNAFCSWLHENGHAPSRVHMRPLKVEKRLVETLDVEAMRAHRQFQAAGWWSRRGQKNFAWWRIHALACALLDTGCRVQELLDACVQDFDMDDLLVTIGTGDQQRRVPFSVELRRILFRYLQQRERFGVPTREAFMFPGHTGDAWDQTDALRSFYDPQTTLRLRRVGPSVTSHLGYRISAAWRGRRLRTWESELKIVRCGAAAAHTALVRVEA